MNEKCLNPNCKSFASSRGLCFSCYGVAARLVRTGRTNWTELQIRGKALPSSRPKIVADWFMEGSK